MVAKCLKATPSDGSEDTKFQTPRNDDGDVRITKIEPTHKDIVDSLGRKELQEPSASQVMSLISCMSQQGFDTPWRHISLGIFDPSRETGIAYSGRIPCND